MGEEKKFGELVRLQLNAYTGKIRMRYDYSEEYVPCNLVADSITKIVYYQYTKRKFINYLGEFHPVKVGFMSIYLAANGKPCRFDELKEVGELVRLVQHIKTGEIVMREEYNEEYCPLNLVCDSITKIVYYHYTKRKHIQYKNEYFPNKVGCMSPYLGANGKPCRFENGEIIEIE